MSDYNLTPHVNVHAGLWHVRNIWHTKMYHTTAVLLKSIDDCFN